MRTPLPFHKPSRQNTLARIFVDFLHCGLLFAGLSLLQANLLNSPAWAKPNASSNLPSTSPKSPSPLPTSHSPKTRDFRSKGSLELSPQTNLQELNQRLRPRRIALLLGIHRYKHNAWNDLRYPKRDVQKLKKLLLQRAQFDELTVLTNPNQTTLQEVRKALLRIKQRVRSPRDTVVIYVSGHGSIAPPQPGTPPERYLVLTDSNKNLPQTGLAIREIKAMMRTLPSQRKALILATCYVGSQAPRRAQLKALPSGIKGTYNLGKVSQTTLILSAAGFMQPAYEVASLRGDVYTHFLVECSYASSHQKAGTTATSVHKCATQKTYAYVQKHLGREQTPSIESKIMGKDNLYWIPPKTPPTTTPFSKPKRVGWLTLLRNNFRTLRFRAKGSKSNATEYHLTPADNNGTLTLRLPQGEYTLIIVDRNGQSATRNVRIIAQQNHQLSSSGNLLQEEKNLFQDIDKAENHDGGFFFGATSDIESRASLFGVRLGVWTRYLEAGISTLFGSASTPQGQPIDDVMLRFGLPFSLGLPWHIQTFDFFFGFNGEIGVQSAQEESFDLTFYALYGLQFRARWWFGPFVALRLSVGAAFLSSPDQPTGKTDNFGSKVYAWRHRLTYLITFGIDHGTW